LFYRYRYTLS